MQGIGIEQHLVDQVRDSLITEENIQKFLGIVEKEGRIIITEYSQLIAE
jgi:hypothetical protein